MKWIAGAFNKANRAKKTCSVFVLCAATAIGLPAQVLTTVHSFDGADGEGPGYGALVQATNGYLYGTTDSGGLYNDGTVFKMTPSGTLTTLQIFCGTAASGCAAGLLPYGGLVQATNGDLYGTTAGGGGANSGTIFKITPSGELTTLYNFCSESGCPDGENPWGTLVQATNGDLYGTTLGGGQGSPYCTSGCGTIFEITPSGTLTTIHLFCSESACVDGSAPQAEALVQSTNGELYGTTTDPGGGVVFSVSLAGSMYASYALCTVSVCAGTVPLAGLIQATNRNFYGTAELSGEISGNNGAVFQSTPSGTLKPLYYFCSQPRCTDGSNPVAALVQATDGNFYGTTEHGGTSSYCGASGCGTLFKITPTGALTTLYNFCSQSGCADGGYPIGALVQDTNGNLYGTTNNGGLNGYGTVFSLSIGVGPFIKTLPTSGKVNAVVKILGSQLTGATSVAFNGTPAASFTVNSASEITVTVPTGATTGTVQVVTPSGTLSGNVPFIVR
jgi:uncharacterized repeat protein (TIGR03803 family)